MMQVRFTDTNNRIESFYDGQWHLINEGNTLQDRALINNVAKQLKNIKLPSPPDDPYYIGNFE